MQLLEYLQNSITKNAELEAIVRAFEDMCKVPIENDMILFETGTFCFTGEDLFYFSLVRQFPNEEEEFYQIHVDVHYKPTDRNREFSEAVWNEELNKDIFSYIRNSEAYAVAKQDEIYNVDIYMDET